MLDRVFSRALAMVLTAVLAAGTAFGIGSAQAATRAAARAEAVPPVPAETGQFYTARGRIKEALRISANATATVKVTGIAGIPGTGVASVSLQVAAKIDSGANQLIIYPSGITEPGNTTSIRTRSTIYTKNMLLMKVGSDGNIKVANKGAAAVTVYLDSLGYTTSVPGSSAGSTFVPLRPARIAHVSIPKDGNHTLAPLGQGGIPTAGVVHVVFTIATRSATAGKLTAYQSGTSKPEAANLDYGTNLYLQNHVIVKLGTDGKAIINNAGPAVTVDIDAYGYTAGPTAPVYGAGTQPLNPARLANRVAVAAGATYTLSPLGQGGVPASGVSGVAFNVTAQNTTDTAGSVRVYPSGTGSPGTHAVQYHPDNQVYSGFVTAKLGTDGKVTILNSGTASVLIWVDVYAYFKIRAGCPPGVAAQRAGVAADLPIEQYSPTTVMQASPLVSGSASALEYAFTDNIGRVTHGHQPDPGIFDSIQWQVITDSNDAFTGRPVMSEEADGRLHVVAQNRVTGNMWARSQATRSPATWAPWTSLGPALGSHATVARHDDTLVSFAVSTGGRLLALPQYNPSGAYLSWLDLGLSGLSTASTPVAVPVSGGVQVFALDTAGTWRTALYAHGSLAGCTILGGSGFTGQPAVVKIPGSVLRVFTRAADGRILTKQQDDGGSWSAPWEQVGDLVAKGSPSALLSTATGRVEVLSRGTDDVIYSTGETLQGSGVWRPWKDTRKVEEGDTFLSYTDPTAFEYLSGSGPAWSFIARDIDNRVRFYHVSETAARTRNATEAPSFTPHLLPAPPAAR